MSDLETILPERVQLRLDALGKSKRAVSLAIGANAGYVRDLFDPERFNVPSAKRMRDLAAELETTIDYLTGDTEDPAPVISQVAFNGRRIDWKGPEQGEPGVRLVGTGDCAFLVVTDTASGQQIAVERSSFDDDAHERLIARPPALTGTKEAYAITFRGRSMEPRFEDGEIGYVNPLKPAGPGDYVVVQLTNGEEDAVTTVLVKRLVRKSTKEVMLEQFNPPLVFTIPAGKVARIHRILPPTEALFG